MVKKETLGRNPKDGGKEELGEEEWVSPIPWVLGRPRYDKTTQLY